MSSQPIAISRSPSHSDTTDFSIHPHPLFTGTSFGHSVNSLGASGASFGSRFYPGSSPGHLLNPLDPNDFKCRLSSSIESDHGSLIKALNGDITREDELCRNYSCCGLPLTDLHALVEHFEDAHVVVLDNNNISYNPHSDNYSLSNNSLINPRSSLDSSSLAGALGVNPQLPVHSPRSIDPHASAFDPDDMDLDLDSDDSTSPSPPSTSPFPSSASHSVSLPHYSLPYPRSQGSTSQGSSPPDTPLLPTPVSQFPLDGNLFPWGPSDNSPSPLALPTLATPNHSVGPAAFDTTAVHAPKHALHTTLAHPYAKKPPSFSALAPLSLASRGSLGSLSRGNSGWGTGFTSAALGRALNGYAGYSDYSSGLPGTIGSSAHHQSHAHHQLSAPGDKETEGAIPPALLFAPVGGYATAPRGDDVGTPGTTPGCSRAASPVSATSSPSHHHNNASASGSTPHFPGVHGGHASVFGLDGKRGDKGPAAGSSMGSGASTTLSRPASNLLLSKPFKCPKPGCMKSYKQANGLKYHMTHGSCNFTPPLELTSLSGLSEREAERKLRPFCCQVPPCQRRYKNMNGLRYHYQHSGDHGAIGLALLASGNHDATKSQGGDLGDAGGERGGAGSGAGGVGLVGGERSGASSAHSSPVAGVAALAPSQLTGAAAAAFRSQPASAYASPWASPRAAAFALLLPSNSGMGSGVTNAPGVGTSNSTSAGSSTTTTTTAGSYQMQRDAAQDYLVQHGLNAQIQHGMNAHVQQLQHGVSGITQMQHGMNAQVQMQHGVGGMNQWTPQRSQLGDVVMSGC